MSLTMFRPAWFGRRLGSAVLAVGLTTGALVGLGAAPVSAEAGCTGDLCAVVPDTVQTPAGSGHGHRERDQRCRSATGSYTTEPARPQRPVQLSSRAPIYAGLHADVYRHNRGVSDHRHFHDSAGPALTLGLA